MQKLPKISRLFVVLLGISLTTGCSQLQDILDDLGQEKESPTTKAPPAYVDLPGDGLFPEGIITAASGDVFVTSFGNGSVVRFTEGKNPGYFKEPGEDGLSSAVGMAIDEDRDRLWVTNFDFATFSSNLKVFDLHSGNLLATLTTDSGGAGSFFNELAIDRYGRVYISDTATPSIWVADADLKGVSLLVSDSLLANPDPDRPFGLNGLTLTPDECYLIASVMDRIDQGDGRLVRIDLQTKSVQDVTLMGEPVPIFGGSDGMFFNDGLLFMVNVTPPAAIITAQFSSDYTSAELVARNTFEEVYNRPTASMIREGRLWTVNSQLDHIIDDENEALGTPPDLPFQLVNVSLKELLAE